VAAVRGLRIVIPAGTAVQTGQCRQSRC
jgi:hypothetical protein